MFQKGEAEAAKVLRQVCDCSVQRGIVEASVQLGWGECGARWNQESKQIGADWGREGRTLGLVGHCKISYFCSAGTVRQLQDFEEE